MTVLLASSAGRLQAVLLQTKGRFDGEPGPVASAERPGAPPARQSTIWSPRMAHAVTVSAWPARASSPPPAPTDPPKGGSSAQSIRAIALSASEPGPGPNAHSSLCDPRLPRAQMPAWSPALARSQSGATACSHTLPQSAGAPSASPRRTLSRASRLKVRTGCQAHGLCFSLPPSESPCTAIVPPHRVSNEEARWPAPSQRDRLARLQPGGGKGGKGSRTEGIKRAQCPALHGDAASGWDCGLAAQRATAVWRNSIFARLQYFWRRQAGRQQLDEEHPCMW